MAAVDPHRCREGGPNQAAFRLWLAKIAIYLQIKSRAGRRDLACPAQNWPDAALVEAFVGLACSFLLLSHSAGGESQPALAVFTEAPNRVGAEGYSVRDSASHASTVYSGVFCLLAFRVARDWRGEISNSRTFRTIRFFQSTKRECFRLRRGNSPATYRTKYGSCHVTSSRSLLISMARSRRAPQNSR